VVVPAPEYIPGAVSASHTESRLDENRFAPSGAFPTAFAAQELCAES